MYFFPVCKVQVYKVVFKLFSIKKTAAFPQLFFAYTFKTAYDVRCITLNILSVKYFNKLFRFFKTISFRLQVKLMTD